MNTCCFSGFTRMVPIAILLFVSMAKAGDIKGTVKLLGGRGIEYAVLYIERVEEKAFSPPQENPVVDQIRMTFVPHVLPVLAGTTVNFPNSDSTRHNVFSPSKTKKFNLGTYPAGVTKQVTFDKTGVVSLLCNVHPEMAAFVLVFQNPHYAMPDKTGKYSIRHVPQGKYTLVAWHPKFKEKRVDVTVPAEGSIVIDFSLDE